MRGNKVRTAAEMQFDEMMNFFFVVTIKDGGKKAEYPQPQSGKRKRLFICQRRAYV